MSPSYSILVIDDEPDIREVMAAMLSDEGHTVRTAPDGRAAIRMAGEDPPQIVVTDVRMPGMSGIEVLAHLKAHFPEIEVVVATAFGEMDLAVQALRLDASDFITKPVGHDNLTLAIQRAGERFSSRERLRAYTQLLEKEKAQTSQELLKTIAFQRNLIESSMDGILGCDADGRLVIYNAAMALLSGHPREAVLGKMTFASFFPQEEAARFNAALESEAFGGRGRLFLYETVLVASDGREIPVQASAVSLSDEGGAGGRVGFFRDLRRIRRLEHELADQARILHQDKMMSLGRLAASVVHEINNPLAGILNYARLMAKVLGKGELSGAHREKFARYLNIIETETDRCSRIVSNLLGFSRRSPSAFAPVDTAELIQRSVVLSRHKLEMGRIALEIDIADALPLVEGDFNQLQQCMINLVFNAADAMAEGGTLTISVQPEDGGKTVEIQVADTGPGIAEAHLSEIFEPFFTTKSEGHGLGLGLSTVYGIIERHRGSVTAENRAKGGALFRIRLPAFSGDAP